MGELVYLQAKQNRRSSEDEMFDERGFGYINGELVSKPKDSFEYQMLLKHFLEEDDYKDVLLGIMDDEYYEKLEPQLQKIVWVYMNL